MSDFDSPFGSPFDQGGAGQPQVQVQYGAIQPLEQLPVEPEDLQRIADTGKLMTVAGALTVVTGVVDAIREMLAEQWIQGGLEVLILVAVGVTTFNAGKKLAAIPESQTGQQKRLVEGLSQMRVAYMTKGLLIFAVIGVFILSFMGITLD